MLFKYKAVDDKGKVLGNCCLGVLCRVAGIEPKINKDNQPLFFGTNGSFNKKLCKKTGISDPDATKLTEMNDWKNNRFKTIANFIEINIGEAK